MISTATTKGAGQDDYLFGKRQTWWIFSLFCILMIFDFADRMVIAAVLPSIKSDFDLTDAQSGLLSSALFLCMVLFALLASSLIDRWSRTRTGGLMGGIWSLASGAGALAVSFPQLLVTRAVVGAGEAGYLPAGIAWLTAAFPQRRRQFAMSILLSSQSVGTLLGLATGGIIASYYSWRHALGLLAIPGLIVSVLLYRSRDYQSIKRAVYRPASGVEDALVVGPDASPESTREERFNPGAAAGFDGWRVIIGTPSLWLSFLALSMLTLAAVPMHYFMPTLFHRVHDVPLQQAAFMASAVMLASALSMPLGGWIMDRRSQSKPENKLAFAIVVFSLGVTLNGLAFGVVTDLGPRFTLMLLATAIGSSAASSVLTLTQELVPGHRRAFSSTCCIITAHLLGSVPGPWLVGRLSDTWGLPHALLIVSVVSGTLAAITLLIAKGYYKRDYQRAAPYRLVVLGQGSVA